MALVEEWKTGLYILSTFSPAKPSRPDTDLGLGLSSHKMVSGCFWYRKAASPPLLLKSALGFTVVSYETEIQSVISLDEKPKYIIVLVPTLIC